MGNCFTAFFLEVLLSDGRAGQLLPATRDSEALPAPGVWPPPCSSHHVQGKGMALPPHPVKPSCMGKERAEDKTPGGCSVHGLVHPANGALQALLQLLPPERHIPAQTQ